MGFDSGGFGKGGFGNGGFSSRGFSGPPPVTGPTVADNFTRANSTTTMGSTSTGNKPWLKTASAGPPVFGIINNQAYCVARNTGIRQTVCDCGSGSGTVTATYPLLPALNRAGIIMRAPAGFIDTSDYVRLVVSGVNATTILLDKVVGGTGATLFSTGVAQVAPAVLSLKITAAGKITAIVNGVTVYDATPATIPPAANTYHGLYIGDDVTQSANDRASAFAFTPA